MAMQNPDKYNRETAQKLLESESVDLAFEDVKTVHVEPVHVEPEKPKVDVQDEVYIDCV